MARIRVKQYAARNPANVKSIEEKCKAKRRHEALADLVGFLKARESKFWKKVDRRGSDECWNWSGDKVRGYGRFLLVTGFKVTASRASYILANGAVPDGLYVCHKCDNPSCCNPAHLYAGTSEQNAIDREVRNRSKPRSGHKINEETAMKIFEAVGTQEAIAAKFGVSRSYVSMVKSGKRWKRITNAVTINASQVI